MVFSFEPTEDALGARSPCDMSSIGISVSLTGTFFEREGGEDNILELGQLESPDGDQWERKGYSHAPGRVFSTYSTHIYLAISIGISIGSYMLQREVSPSFLVRQDTSKQCRIRHGLHVCQKNLLERVGRSGNLPRTCWMVILEC